MPKSENSVMERNRELRRAGIVSSNGFNRRSHRTNMFRDSPDEGGGVELQESVRLRDRTKKDREMEREKDRERRGGEKNLRERSNWSKRRREQRLTINRDDIGGDEFSDESLIDDEYEDDEDATATRLIPAAAVSNQSLNSSLIQQYSSNNTNSVGRSNHHLQHRKGLLPASSSSSSKAFTAAPIWKPDEIINVSVPRKARSSSTKRSLDRTSTSSNNYGGGGGEQVQGGVSTSTPSPAAPMSPPSSSNAPFRKKLKSGGDSGGQKVKPPKAAVKQSSSNPEKLEIEIAEVLYGLMSQSPVPSSKKEDSREVDRSNDPVQPVAPKRKRPRAIPENSSHGGSVKLDMDKKTKSEISSPEFEKNSASNGDNVPAIGGISSSQGPEPTASTSVKMNLVLRESGYSAVKKDMSLPKEKKFSVMRDEKLICMDTALTATASAVMINANALVSDVENQRQQKLEIDLMAPPPQVRSTPEGEIKIHFKATTTAADQKTSFSISTMPGELKDKLEKTVIAKEQSESAAVGESKEKWTVQEAGLKKEIENKGRSVVDVQLDLEKTVGNGNAAVNSSGYKLQLYNDKQQQQEMSIKANREEPLPEKSSQSKSSMPLPVPMASWPGGLPPMGYMAPLQGVVSMDGSAVAPAPIQPLFSQPRPRRCATHSYIARSIHGLQQVMKMNPFWHVGAGSASLFGSKPGNFNLMHADLHGNIACRGINNAPGKGNDLSSNPNHTGRDTGSQTASTSDSGHRKQPILIQAIQQSLPPIPATNLLGPAFIFPLNQQQAAVAAVSAQPSSTKSASVGGSTATSDPSATVAVAPAMSFNYPAMAANEAQYLAILQNNAYPFPAVGTPPNYRGNPALFNGSFYSSPMIHPSQLQHQQTPSVQSPQLQKAHSNSSSSQGHLLSLQPRPQSSGANGVNSQDSPGPKSQPSQESQQSNNPHPPPRARHFDGELGSERSPATNDSKGTRGSVNIYGQNFAMPIHPHNFALMTPPTALTGASPASGSSNQRKKQQQQSLAQHGFAMSFGTINGANTGPALMTQNHAIFPAAAAAAQPAQKPFRESADDKSGVDDSVSSDPERKKSTTKAEGVGQSTAFSRSDSVNAPLSSAQANCVNVVESSGQSPNVTSSTARSSQPGTTSSVSAINAPNNHFQGLLQQKQLATTAVNRTKAPGASNGSLFPDHLNSSSIMAAKYPTGFPQNFVQSSTSLSQYTQWRSSTKTLTSQSPSALASSGVATTKNLSQQTHISFGGNQKPSSSQGQASPSSNQVPSPTASSISRVGSGSSRTTTSASSNTKSGQNSIHNQKLPSVLGHPHVASSSSSGAKHPQQQQTTQQTQLFFSNPYSQSQSATSSPGGFYMQRRGADQQQQPSVVPPTGILTSSSTTMNDPAKAIAAATVNVKGGGLASQGMILPAATFSYPHPVPAAVQVKPAEQKQPAG